MSTLLATTVWAAESPKSEEEKTLYAVGLNVSKTLSVFNLSPAELETVILGIKDGQAGKKTDIDFAVYSRKYQELAKLRRKALIEKQAPANKEFLEKAAKEKGAVKTESGLIFLSLLEGKDPSPKATDSVKVNFRGTQPDGREFVNGQPSVFRLDGGYVKCLSEGIQKMKTGGKARLVCPASIGYGDKGLGDVVLPGATLNFEVELIEIIPSLKADKPSVVKPSHGHEH
jgi:FKBP-type peptidyl-prolyl cis-trans isomerase FkpA